MTEHATIEHPVLVTPEKRDNSEILRLEYRKALEKFATARGHSLMTDLEEQGALDLGLSNMRHNYDLLQDIGDETETKAREPICTITIPVALLHESIEQILNTVDLIKKSQRDSNELVELIIWTNATYGAGDKDTIESQASAKYDDLFGRLQQHTGRNIRIRSALQTFPTEDFSMSKLRSNMMDAVAIDSDKKGYGFTHPVMWLDVDTTFISRGAIESLGKGIHNMSSVFSHANLMFSIDWAGDKTLEEMDDATKAVAINEINRRQAQSLIPRKAVGYVEESGFVFSTGVYLNAGGVDTAMPISESAGLLRRALAVEDDYVFDASGRIIDNRLVPDSILRCMDPRERFADGRRRETFYMQRAKIGTSARRHYEVAKEKGAMALSTVDESGYGDELYIQRKPITDDKVVPISTDQIKELVNWHHAGWETVASRDIKNLQLDENKMQVLGPQTIAKIEKNKRVGHRVVERYFN